jgi:hypothetical protein
MSMTEPDFSWRAAPKLNVVLSVRSGSRELELFFKTPEININDKKITLEKKH